MIIRHVTRQTTKIQDCENALNEGNGNRCDSAASIPEYKKVLSNRLYRDMNDGIANSQAHLIDEQDKKSFSTLYEQVLKYIFYYFVLYNTCYIELLITFFSRMVVRYDEMNELSVSNLKNKHNFDSKLFDIFVLMHSSV